MFLIIMLLILGGLLVVAELILFPGLSVAGICAIASFGGAVYLGFENFSSMAGYIIAGAAVVISILSIIISLRSNLWQKLSLKTSLESDSTASIKTTQELIGKQGKCVSRLAPMGKVKIDESIYEASSQGGYIDQDSDIEVTGIENSNLIVKKL